MEQANVHSEGDDESGPPTRPGPRHVETQSLLFRFTDRLYRAHSLAEVYDAALDAICEGLDSPRASILRVDDAGLLRFIAWRNLSERYRDEVNRLAQWQPEGRAGVPFCIEDIDQAAEPDFITALLKSESIRGLAFIPLAIDETVIGRFTVYYDRPRLLDEQERELALTIARQLGFAIERSIADTTARRLAAIVGSSQDAIISKNLDGIITSWNDGAEQLFGYVAHEAIGRSITMLIPPDRHDEEPGILARIRAGERVTAFETVRQHRDGHQIDISLSISPIMDASGKVVGASKIARDITDKRRTQERQSLLLREMNHRVKNLFALASSLIQLSARTASSPAELAMTVSDRLAALSRAHGFTIRADLIDDHDQAQLATLLSVIRAILEPFCDHPEDAEPQIHIAGDDVALPNHLLTPLALLFYELATNATKYGSLSVPEGHVQVQSSANGDSFTLLWKETGGPPVTRAAHQGFGSMLVRASAGQLGAVNHHWDEDGLRVEMTVNLASD